MLLTLSPILTFGLARAPPAAPVRPGSWILSVGLLPPRRRCGRRLRRPSRCTGPRKRWPVPTRGSTGWSPRPAHASSASSFFRMVRGCDVLSSSFGPVWRDPHRRETAPPSRGSLPRIVVCFFNLGTVGSVISRQSHAVPARGVSCYVGMRAIIFFSSFSHQIRPY